MYLQLQQRRAGRGLRGCPGQPHAPERALDKEHTAASPVTLQRAHWSWPAGILVASQRLLVQASPWDPFQLLSLPGMPARIELLVQLLLNIRPLFRPYRVAGCSAAPGITCSFWTWETRCRNYLLQSAIVTQTNFEVHMRACLMPWLMFWHRTAVLCSDCVCCHEKYQPWP